VDKRLVVLRPASDGVKRRAHDADLKGMVVIRSPHPRLVPFKLYRFGETTPCPCSDDLNQGGLCQADSSLRTCRAIIAAIKIKRALNKAHNIDSRLKYHTGLCEPVY
jgi:hypothetical protein